MRQDLIIWRVGKLSSKLNERDREKERERIDTGKDKDLYIEKQKYSFKVKNWE